MNETVQRLEERLLQRGKFGKDDENDETDLDELLEGEDEFLAHYREKRVQELSDHFKTIGKNVSQKGYGSLEKFDDESSLMKVASKTPRAVVHFGLDTFQKCKYMDQKLELLAESHLTTKFMKIDVGNCPFLVSKLNVKVLPFVVGYKNGEEVTRIVGFSKLGNDPNGFSIETLENLFVKVRVIQRQNFEPDGLGDHESDLSS